MKTLEVEIALMKYFGIRKNLIVPNVSNWSNLLNFEADLLVLSGSGYASCIEIKVSKTDLKRDLTKKHIFLWTTNYNYFKHYYRDLKHYYRDLKYFYYAVPKKLQEDALAQIPKFAGLLVLDYYEGEVCVTEVRKPRVLFKKKWSEQERYLLARLGTMRILGLKEKLL